MTPFTLKIVTPDGLIYDGEAEKLVVRTTGGDICILARHLDYVAALGMGMATVEANGKRRNAACIGGMVSVKAGEVTLVPTTFEWADKIDLGRAEASYTKADKVLKTAMHPIRRSLWHRQSCAGLWSVRASLPSSNEKTRYRKIPGFYVMTDSNPHPGSNC